MKVYQVSTNGVIQKIYRDEVLFEEENPDITLKVGKLESGFIREKDLAKLILLGIENSGLSKNKELLGLKMELKDTKNELESLKEEVSTVYTSLEKEVTNYTKLDKSNKALDKAHSQLELNEKIAISKIEEVLGA